MLPRALLRWCPVVFLPRYFKAAHEPRHVRHEPGQTLAPLSALCLASRPVYEEMPDVASFQHSLACGCIVPGSDSRFTCKAHLPER